MPKKHPRSSRRFTSLHKQAGFDSIRPPKPDSQLRKEKRKDATESPHSLNIPQPPFDPAVAGMSEGELFLLADNLTRKGINHSARRFVIWRFHQISLTQIETHLRELKAGWAYSQGRIALRHRRRSLRKIADRLLADIMAPYRLPPFRALIDKVDSVLREMSESELAPLRDDPESWRVNPRFSTVPQIVESAITPGGTYSPGFAQPTSPHNPHAGLEAWRSQADDFDE